MKLVIDIDDALYKAICDCESPQILSHFAIKNGIPYEERPHGEIITDEDGNTSCSECGQTSVFGNFCYNCGADLREGDKE